MITEKDFGRLIQRTLLAGVFLSSLLMLAGFGFLAAGLPPGRALLKAGVLVLLVTPAARVAMLVYGYLRGGEHYFALASFMVLALLLISALV
ncbi:MAG: hypothetical protein A2049_10240 [Elusimicrobia bacterium GWA2_62_23]|nr:MAG: hypothetical protein A2049_10240 [Elusimicrobia bacterium GWA2_62_23]